MPSGTSACRSRRASRPCSSGCSRQKTRKETRMAEGRAEDWSHLSGRIVGDTHVLPVRVYYEDTDFSGVVYHANYLRFLERGRTDYLRLAGIDQSDLHAGGEGLILAVRRMTLDFLRPARMDEVLLVETRAADVLGASFMLA